MAAILSKVNHTRKKISCTQHSLLRIKKTDNEREGQAIICLLSERFEDDRLIRECAREGLVVDHQAQISLSYGLSMRGSHCYDQGLVQSLKLKKFLAYSEDGYPTNGSISGADDVPVEQYFCRPLSEVLDSGNGWVFFPFCAKVGIAGRPPKEEPGICSYLLLVRNEHKEECHFREIQSAVSFRSFQWH